MTFYEKFDRICRINGISKSAACAAIGLDKAAASQWKKCNSLPRKDTVKALADYFGVDVLYFHDSSDKQTNPESSQCREISVSLTDNEKLLLDSFRALDAIQQIKALSAIIELAESVKKASLGSDVEP